MSTKEVVTFGTETWARGTRGIHRPHMTNRPYIYNLQMYSDGILGPRPLWNFFWQSGGTPNPDYATYDQAAPMVLPFKYTTIAVPGKSVPGLLVIQRNGNRHFYSYNTDYDGLNETLTPYAESTSPPNGPHGSNIYRTTTGRDQQALVWASRITESAWLVHGFLIEAVGASGAAPQAMSVSTVEGPTGSLTLKFWAGASPDFKGFGSVVHQGRAYYWGSGVADVTSPVAYEGLERIYYSDANAGATDLSTYTTFTSADQYFPVGGDVAGCASIGSNLLIWTVDGKWYALQGRGDPALATLNFLGEGRIPGVNTNSSYGGAFGVQPVLLDNTLFFMSSDEATTVTVSSSGQQNDVELAHIAFDADGAGQFLEQLNRPWASSAHNQMIIPKGRQFYHLSNGVWTLQNFYHDAADISATDAQHLYLIDDHAGIELVVWTSDDDVADHVMMAYRPLNPTAPNYQVGVSGLDDTYSSGKADGELGLPRIMDPSANIRITRVIVDGVWYEYSASGTDYPVEENMKMEIATPRWTSETPITGTLGPASIETTWDTTFEGEGYRGFRAEFTVDTMAPYESFADIYFSQMRLIGVERVTVEYEKSRGRNF